MKVGSILAKKCKQQARKSYYLSGCRSEGRVVVLVLFQVSLNLLGCLLLLRALRCSIRNIIVISLELRALSVSVDSCSTTTGGTATITTTRSFIVVLTITVRSSTTAASATTARALFLLHLGSFLLSAFNLLCFLELDRELHLLDLILHGTFTIVFEPLLLFNDLGQFLVESGCVSWWRN